MCNKSQTKLNKVECLKTLYPGLIAAICMVLLSFASCAALAQYAEDLSWISGGHNWVSSIAYSPDGAVLASAGADNTIKIWQTANGKCQRSIYCKNFWITSISFSTDGKTLAAGCDDGMLRIWRIADGIMVQSSITGVMRCVVHSPDGKYLAAANDSGDIFVYQLGNDMILNTAGQLAQMSSISALAFSKDSRYLASGDFYGEMKIWRLSDWSDLKSFQGHDGTVWGLQFTSDGTKLVSASSDFTAKVWRVSDATCLLTMTHPVWVDCLALSPDNTTLATGCDDGVIRYWRMSDGYMMGESDDTGSILAVKYSNDGATLASGNSEGKLDFWNTADYSLRLELTKHHAIINQAAYSPDGSVAASASYDGTVRLWDTSDGTLLETIDGLGSPVYSLAFSPDNQMLAFGTDDGIVRVWSLAADKIAYTFTSHTQKVTSIVFTADSGNIISASEDAKIIFTNLATQTDYRTISELGSVQRIALSADEKTLASARTSSTAIRLFKTSDGSFIRSLTGHSKAINSMAFSSDNIMLNSASADASIKVWQLSSGACLRTITTQTAINSMAPSPDGKVFAVAGAEGAIKLVKYADGSIINTWIQECEEGVSSVAYAPNGRGLLWGRNDGSVLLAKFGFAPTISNPSLSVTQNGPVSYIINYTGAASVNLTKDNITLNKLGTANGTVSVTGTGLLSRTITISNITGDGELSISLAANTATDTDGKKALAVGPSISFIVDNTPPAVTISSPSTVSTKKGPVTYTINYTGADVVNLSTSDITVSKTGTADCTLLLTGTGLTTRTATLSGITGNGTLSISVAAGTAYDNAGNISAAAGPSGEVVINNDVPMATIGAPSLALTRNTSVSFTISYSGATKIALDASQVVLSRTGTANGAVVVSGTGSSTRTVIISNIAGTGTIGISLLSGTASDDQGNLSLPAGPSQTFTVDNTPPSISLSMPSATSTAIGPVSYTISYIGADNITLKESDITLVKTGTANGTIEVINGLPPAPSSKKRMMSAVVAKNSSLVTIKNITGDGTLAIKVAAGSASDIAGNLCPAAGPSMSFKVDNSAGPVVKITSPSTLSSYTRNCSDLTIKGTADDPHGMQSVKWTCSNQTSGTCNGTSQWTTSGIQLSPGDNTIVITATNSLNNSTSVTVMVNYTDSLPGDAWTGIAMVSLPIIPDDIDPLKVTGAGLGDWFSYDPAGSYIGYENAESWFIPQSGTPGRGFWAKFGTTPVVPKGIIPAQIGSISIHLEKGWNLVGQPFIKQIRWDLDSVMVSKGGNAGIPLGQAQDLVRPYAWGWDSSTSKYYLVYDPNIVSSATDVMKPWQAFWVKALDTCDIIFSAP